MNHEQDFVSKKEIELIKEGGGFKIGDEYPIYNNFDHTIIDMSNLRSTKEDWGHTLSIKLPNGNFVTLCVMQCSDEQSCIDARFYGDNMGNHGVLGFKNGGTKSIYDQGTYALVLNAKEKLAD